MSLLAEPRRKQKISVDPNNKNWHRDKSKFGQKMLEKMGWSEGKGLGAAEDGRTEHVKPKVNADARGLGSKFSPDDVWLTHQDNFSALLQSLNAGKPSSNRGTSLEERSKASRARIHYHKFARMKDAGAYSSEDMGSILGKRGREKRARHKAPVEKEVESAEPETLVTVSTTSAADHYAAAMAEKLAKLRSPVKFTQETEPAEVAVPKKKKKKGRKEAEAHQEEADVAEGTGKRKKGKRRKRNHSE